MKLFLKLSSLFLVLCFVACGPANNRVAITKQSPTDFQMKVSACADTLLVSQKLKLGSGSTSPDSRTVKVCEYPEDATGALSAKLGKVEKAVSFSVQKPVDDGGKHRTVAGAIELDVLLGFKTPEPLSDKEQAQVIAAFNRDCAPEIEQIFSRSHFGGAISVRLKLIDPKFVPLVATVSADEVVTDEDIRLQKSGADGEGSFELSALPSKPKFSTLGFGKDNEACAKAGGTKETISLCTKAARKLANRPACAAIAKRVGNTLGISDLAGEAATCGMPLLNKPAVTKGQSTGDAAPLVDEGVSTFAKPSPSDEDFLSKSSLNRQDLMTILSPVCPELKTSK